MSHRDQQITIGERVFTIRTLSFGKAREVYAKLQRVLVGYVDDEASSFGVMMGAMMGGALPDADFDFIVERFGEVTTVESKLPDGTPQTLKLTAQHRENIFAGAFEDIFDWVESCIQLNFAGVIKKLAAAEEKVKAARAEKTTETPT